jgi:hypothetical protein
MAARIIWRAAIPILESLPVDHGFLPDLERAAVADETAETAALMEACAQADEKPRNLQRGPIP